MVYQIKIGKGIKEKEMPVKAIGELAIYYGDKQNNGDYDNGIWMNILDIPFISNIEEAGLYKTVIRTLWLEASGWSKEIRNKFPHVKQIGLSDHPLSTHVSRLGAERQYAYLSDLQYLDGMMALTEEERQFYQTTLPHIPVIRVGLPFPVESYETRYGHLRNSEKKYIGLGVGASDNDRNFVSNLMAFRKLQLNNPDLAGIFLSIPDQLLSYCSYWADRVPNVYIHQRTEMGEYYDLLSQCKFVYNLTDRNTPGRLQGEAAFFEIPVIGSNRLELQTELFPDLALKPFMIEDAVTLGQRLLDNPKEGETMAKKAHKKLVANYNYDISRNRFKDLVKTVEGE
jgi:glycosyltransferase involved in cell wall biosynthesis